jgi:hypothetical protein
MRRVLEDDRPLRADSNLRRRPLRCLNGIELTARGIEVAHERCSARHRPGFEDVDRPVVGDGHVCEMSVDRERHPRRWAGASFESQGASVCLVEQQDGPVAAHVERGCSDRREASSLLEADARRAVAPGSRDDSSAATRDPEEVLSQRDRDRVTKCQ